MQNIPTVPSAVDAEIALIGCILIDENLMFEAQDLLVPSDFYDHKNRLIFQVMIELARNGKHIDVTTVVATLEKNGLLVQAGGMDYLLEIGRYEYTTANKDTYINMISETALKRNTIDALTQLIQKGYDSSIEAFDYVDSVEKKVFELSKTRRVDDFKTIREISQTVLENTEKNASRDEDVIGLDTGFVGLNKHTQGLQPGQLIILAARPAMGKSAFALNLAINVAQKNKNGNASVAIFSLEMPAEQLVERMAASESSISLKAIKSGRLQTKNDWIRLTTACNKLSNLNIYFDSDSDSSIATIRNKCRKLKAEEGKGLDLIVIDYLQLIKGDSARASQVEIVTKISRGLKLMALELGIPVIALSQLSRKVEERDDKKPIMADLRDSGSIEQDADIVMFLYRDDYYNKASEKKGEAELIISKNRSGSLGSSDFIFSGEIQKFREKKEESSF